MFEAFCAWCCREKKLGWDKAVAVASWESVPFKSLPGNQLLAATTITRGFHFKCYSNLETTSSWKQFRKQTNKHHWAHFQLSCSSAQLHSSVTGISYLFLKSVWQTGWEASTVQLRAPAGFQPMCALCSHHALCLCFSISKNGCWQASLMHKWQAMKTTRAMYWQETSLPTHNELMAHTDIP